MTGHSFLRGVGFCLEKGTAPDFTVVCGEQVLILFLVLEDIDPNKVYILGGLVDESIHKVGSSLLEPAPFSHESRDIPSASAS